MSYFYSLLKKITFTALFGIFCMFITKAQCGPIVQDFSTPNDMAGFSSSTQGNSDPGFTWGNNGIFSYLQRCSIPNPSTFIIISPTYQTAVSQTSIGVGFDLDGEVDANQVTIFIDYNSGGNIVSQQIAQVTPVYAANHASICVSGAINTLPGFVAGMMYRVKILISAPAATNNNQCIRFDNFRTTGNDSQIGLPVSFIGVNARKSGMNTEISWTVASEKEVSHYVIEKSTDARSYINIGEVTADGSTAYRFTEKNSGQGIVYYRVKNIDLDGKFSYSNVVKLNLEGNVHLLVYPQPVRSQLTVEHLPTLNGKLVITTASGLAVRSVQVKSGNSQTSINVSDLGAGMYIVRLETADGTSGSVKIIKQ